LTKPEQGKAAVTIIQPPALRAMIDARQTDLQTDESGEKRYLTVSGYTVQVFTGNNQRRSKDEAFEKKSQIERRFNEVAAYVDYKSPFWRLRVGDFQTYEEALRMMYQLTESFPSFRQEIKIVRENVRVFIN
jgi:hypothetical protein